MLRLASRDFTITTHAKDRNALYLQHIANDFHFPPIADVRRHSLLRIATPKARCCVGLMAPIDKHSKLLLLEFIQSKAIFQLDFFQMEIGHPDGEFGAVGSVDI